MLLLAVDNGGSTIAGCAVEAGCLTCALPVSGMLTQHTKASTLTVKQGVTKPWFGILQQAWAGLATERHSGHSAAMRGSVGNQRHVPLIGQ